MASETDHVVPKPLQDFKRVQAEFCKLTEGPNNELPYKEGVSLSRSDVTAMRIQFDLNASTDFWKHAEPNTRRALKKAFCDLDELLSERAAYKRELTECHSSRIKDAYMPSAEYIRVLENLVYKGIKTKLCSIHLAMTFSGVFSTFLSHPGFSVL